MKLLLPFLSLLLLACIACAKFDIFYFQINPNSVTIKQGDTTYLKASASYSGKDSIFFKWSSENPSIAVVDENGVVVGKLPGDVNISVKCDNQEKICNVTVTDSSSSATSSASTH